MGSSSFKGLLIIRRSISGGRLLSVSAHCLERGEMTYISLYIYIYRYIFDEFDLLWQDIKAERI